MGGEVYSGYVDTSLAGLGNTLERSEAIDFTQEVFHAIEGLGIKRPLKTDFSVRYFWLGKFSTFLHVFCNDVSLHSIFRIHKNIMVGIDFSYNWVPNHFDDNDSFADLFSS